MSTNTMSRRIASALLLGVAVAGCASGPRPSWPDRTQAIESARTREDHEALAKSYDTDAASARKLAEEHRKMARSYQAMAGGGKGGSSMASHCNAIVRSQDTIAAEYEAMAAEHRKMAEMTKP